LNSIAKVPAVALLMNAQRNPNILGAIVPRLMEEMVDEVAVVYAGTVISVVSTIYSETATPRPGTYAAAMTGMLSDLRFLQEKTSNGIEKLNADMLYIDAANRSLGNGLNWRAKGK
jgi:hypothetical protein